MSVLVVLILAALLILLVALPLGKRERVNQLLTELDRDDAADELADAEEEVRDLDVMTGPDGVSSPPTLNSGAAIRTIRLSFPNIEHARGTSKRRLSRLLLSARRLGASVIVPYE